VTRTATCCRALRRSSIETATVCRVHGHPVLSAQCPQVTAQHICRDWRTFLAHENWHTFCPHLRQTSHAATCGRSGRTI
jgi:hypothetical protein